MPIENKMMRDGRVLINTYTNPLDFVEIAHNITAMHRLYLDAATQPVHIIADFTAITQFPSHILSGSRQMTHKIHPMSGSAPLVMPNTVMIMIGETIRRLTHNADISVFHTLDEAMHYVDSLLEKEKKVTGKSADVPAAHL